MSWETQAWAARQRPGSATAKLVLLGLASCADANHRAWPSIQWLCDFSDLNRKTVIAALQRLEDGMFPLIEDTGERRGQTGQIKVYRLAVPTSADALASDPPALRVTETVPKTEQFQKRNSSVFGGKESQKRDTEPVREPFIPPAPAEAGAGPHVDPDRADRQSADRRGSRLPDDWSPPPVADLQPMARKLVEQWPPGAYAAVCETFRLHWQTVTGASARKRNWSAALAKWLMTDHPRVMRAAKSGVSFASPPSQSQTQVSASPPVPVAAKADEDGRSHAIHGALRRSLGVMLYDTWIAPCAILCDDSRVTIVTGSEFQSGWIADRFEARIKAAARAAGIATPWIRYRAEQRTALSPCDA